MYVRCWECGDWWVYCKCWVWCYNLTTSSWGEQQGQGQCHGPSHWLSSGQILDILGQDLERFQCSVQSTCNCVTVLGGGGVRLWGLERLWLTARISWAEYTQTAAVTIDIALSSCRTIVTRSSGWCSSSTTWTSTRRVSSPVRTGCSRQAHRGTSLSTLR